MSGRRRASEPSAFGAEWKSPRDNADEQQQYEGPVDAVRAVRVREQGFQHAAASHHDVQHEPAEERQSACGHQRGGGRGPPTKTRPAAAASHASARMPSRETASATCSGPKVSVSVSTVMRPSTTWNETPWTPSRSASARRSNAASSLQSRPLTLKSSCLRMVCSSLGADSLPIPTIMTRTTPSRRWTRRHSLRKRRSNGVIGAGVSSGTGTTACRRRPGSSFAVR